MLLAVFFPFVGHFWMTAATEEMLAVTALENVNVSLKCTAQMKPGVDYWAVHWYKEGVAPRLAGLVCTTLPNGKLWLYVGADTRTSLEYSTLSLLLPPVTCSDRGVYQCFMVAPVGEQNLEGRVRLNISGCPTVTDPPVIPEREVERVTKRTPQLDTSHIALLCIGALAIASQLCVMFVVCRSEFMRKAVVEPGNIEYIDDMPMKRLLHLLREIMMTCDENKTPEGEPHFMDSQTLTELPDRSEIVAA